MRPHCHCKWRQVFCEKLEFFQFLWKESKTGHSCSHCSSRSCSRWKVMVPKVTPYDIDLGPIWFLSWPSSCLWDKRPKQYPTVEHSEVVQKCKARRRCCCSPGKCLMSWWRALSNKYTVKDHHICFRWAVCSKVCSSVFADQLFLFLCTRFRLSSTDKIRKLFNGKIIGDRVNRLFIIIVVCFICQHFFLISISRTKRRAFKKLQQASLSTCLHITQFAQWQWCWLVFVPEKLWQVPFPCLACSVKPRKRVAVGEDCQGRFLSLPLLHKHMQLVLSQRLFDWFRSLLELFLNKVVILLYPTGDDWANCSHGSRVYNDFGVQGKEASSIVFKWISSFLKRNKSLNVYLSWRLFAVRSFAHGDPCSLHYGCHATLKAFEQTSNLWPRSHPSSQSTWIAGKSYCTSISFYHHVTLLMCLVICLCTTNPP